MSNQPESSPRRIPRLPARSPDSGGTIDYDERKCDPPWIGPPPDYTLRASDYLDNEVKGEILENQEKLKNSLNHSVLEPYL